MDSYANIAKLEDMEKTQTQILEEIRDVLETLRRKIDVIEGQLSALEEASSPMVQLTLDTEPEVIDEPEPVIVAEPEIEAAPEPEIAAEPQPEVVAEPEPELISEPEPAIAPEPELEAVPEPDPEMIVEPEPAVVPGPEYDIPVAEEAVPEPEIAPAVEAAPVAENINESVAASVKPAVIDVMMDKYAWRTDKPGAPVRNILSAISLNDRVLFINSLFGEDPLAFQQAVNAFNGFETLPQAVDYVKEHYPLWDLSSDVVYRFMMAVRRKLN